MIDFLRELMSFVSQLVYIIPFLVAIASLYKTNLGRDKRYKQIFLPLFAIIYCMVASIFYDELVNFFHYIAEFIANILDRILDLFASVVGFENVISIIKLVLDRFVQAIDASSGLTRIIYAIFNPAVIVLYCLIKKPVLSFMDRKISGDENGLLAKINVFYSYDKEDCKWYVARNWGQATDLVKYVITIVNILVCLISACTIYLFNDNKTTNLFYPVYIVIMLVEVYSFVNGEKKEDFEDIIGEDDDARIISNYSILRKFLRHLFGDKLMSENTSINTIQTEIQTNDEVLEQLEKQEDAKLQAYGTFMRRKVEAGMELDQGYLEAGVKLLNGKSIVFNNPFYYDLIPYMFYPMNRMLMQHRKVMIILGRHDIEEDIKKWCVEGLTKVNHLPDLWKVGVLSEEEQDLNVGIVTRSCVHDMNMQQNNKDFFKGVGFVVIIEPSRLLTTAQVGLNSILRQCEICKDEMVYCSVDKNCDGLVDSLSHMLQVSLTEVCASNHHEGLSSYMCWETDDEMLQHRILPNISQYLGMGTELAMVALKNQIPKVTWYGGEAFPVVDMHWIVKQYYYDLLNYAELPASQEVIDKVLQSKVNMWGSKVRNGRCIIVEDESNNMFEMRRCFSSRASKQGFINILSGDYLLKDYMADNNSLLLTDPKAIPYIVADYAHTKRNVAMRLCLRMTTNLVPEDDIRCELKNVGISGADVIEELWKIICECNQQINLSEDDSAGNKTLVIEENGEKYTFYRDIIELKKEYSLKDLGVVKKYYIEDKDFIRLVLQDLLSARYIAEDEFGDKQYLGTELVGQMFQNHLPGQFHTFNGKYYEIIRLTATNELICRRAADQLSNRYTYRQVRDYTLSNLVESGEMGDNIVYDKMRLQMMYADINVKTPAYIQMSAYNDFVNGKKIEVNGIPERNYYNKQIMCIDFSECDGVNDKVINTLTVMLNEMFRTLFAENQGFIIATTAGEAIVQNTYRVNGGEHLQLGDKCIYIIEDSQLDIGLLVAVRRNLHRIFEMINDYFDWHQSAIERSLNTPAKKNPPSFVLSEEEQEALEPPIRGGIIGKFLRWIIRLFKRFFRFIKRLFFGRKKVDDDKEGMVPQGEPSSDEVVEAGVVEGEEYADDDINKITERKPYHLNYYLLFGDEKTPEWLDIEGVRALLSNLGYKNGELEQARYGIELAEQLANRAAVINDQVHYCDFCGRELSGITYEVLQDGRERCCNCGKTAIKTEKEFIEIYHTICKNLKFFYGITIRADVEIKMVNAKRLSKALGETFIPTADFDGRTLGVAINKRGKYTLLIENGSPKLQATMTFVHELTHIWQYLNWDADEIYRKYGPDLELQVYEGMAKWVEIQYAFLINEISTAKLEEARTLCREDEYGYGFAKYCEVYALSEGTVLNGMTPFDRPHEPL
ncbi:MAG: hypothetical protein E7265_08110 [Lachnospiraceae bacterium]|nr:hypothetical protein [Lachnospiraceae bacterium]